MAFFSILSENEQMIDFFKFGTEPIVGFTDELFPWAEF